MTKKSKNIDIASLYNDYIMNTYNRDASTPVIVRGKGCRVWGPNNNVFLDFTSGIAVQNIGHSNDTFIASVESQLKELTHCSNLFFNPNQAFLAKKLVELSGLEGKVFFCNSGAEANEAMIKLARYYGKESGRYEIICMKQSFHGRTMGTLSATGQSKVQTGFEPLLLGFSFAEYNNLESVKELINENTIAIMLEPIQGEGGVIPATEEFMKGVRELCDKHDLLMLVDEVQTGIGRTGKWFGWQNYDVAPDAFSLAKAIAGGVPMGAMVASAKFADVFAPGSHASTFGGGALASAAALSVLSVIEDNNLLQNAIEMGEMLTEGLKQFIEQYDQVLDVRGNGLLIGLVVDGCAKEIVEDLRMSGLLTCVAGPDVVRFVPPLCVSEKDVEEAIDMLSDTLENLYGEDAE